MDMVKHMKQTTGVNALWINTVGLGHALADSIEAQGIPVNRFTNEDPSSLVKYLRCEVHENYQSPSKDE